MKAPDRSLLHVCAEAALVLVTGVGFLAICATVARWLTQF